jgi:hypothetical protein
MLVVVANRISERGVMSIESFFAALLDKDAASPSYQKEARDILENLLLDDNKRTDLIHAYSWRWYNPGFGLEGPEEEGDIETLLSLFQNCEYLWRNIELGAKLVYVDLLLLEGSEESLRKIIELTKNKISITLLEVRIEALFLLYRDFPQSYHVQDLEYFRRKIKEITHSNSSRIEWLKKLSYLIEMMRGLDSETISSPELYEIGMFAEDIVSMIENNRILAKNYGDYRRRERGRRVFPEDRDKGIWDPTLRSLVDFIPTIDGFHKKFILPMGVIKTMKLYKSEVPRDYYEGIIHSKGARLRIVAVRTISTRADYALELLKLFSMDTDRIVRSVVIGKLEDMQRSLLITIRHSKRKNTNEEDLQDKLDLVQELLFEMSENPDIEPFQKKRILVLLGRASYDL